jgi:copper chaperone NosL
MDRVRKSKKEKGKRKKERAKSAFALALFPFYFFLFTFSCGPSRGPVSSDAAFGFCPVCHMKVKNSDAWAAEIYYNDRTKVMFESPGDMVAFYISPGAYAVDDAHKNRANIERIVVKDYQSKQAIDANQAVFVYKSRVEGPMGADFLPFAKRGDAEAFVAVNEGTLLSLKEVTGDMSRELRK